MSDRTGEDVKDFIGEEVKRHFIHVDFHDVESLPNAFTVEMECEATEQQVMVTISQLLAEITPKGVLAIRNICDTVMAVDKQTIN